MLSEEATITNFSLWFEHTIYLTRDEHANHYTTDAVNKLKIISEFLVIKIAEILLSWTLNNNQSILKIWCIESFDNIIINHSMKKKSEITNQHDCFVNEKNKIMYRNFSINKVLIYFCGCWISSRRHNQTRQSNSGHILITLDSVYILRISIVKYYYY